MPVFINWEVKKKGDMLTFDHKGINSVRKSLDEISYYIHNSIDQIAL
jgi:hypothetical protein